MNRKTLLLTYTNMKSQNSHNFDMKMETVEVEKREEKVEEVIWGESYVEY